MVSIQYIASSTEPPRDLPAIGITRYHQSHKPSIPREKIPLGKPTCTWCISPRCSASYQQSVIGDVADVVLRCAVAGRNTPAESLGFWTAKDQFRRSHPPQIFGIFFQGAFKKDLSAEGFAQVTVSDTTMTGFLTYGVFFFFCLFSSDWCSPPPTPVQPVGISDFSSLRFLSSGTEQEKKRDLADLKPSTRGLHNASHIFVITQFLL
ncbi:hypothetical protein QBC34DRAFT_195488 [Podospora aff. communis PSN243]|uniref:Uncharacterized protein n=1 Tax=Podospora aff. communis PSN243 TaxID=3040156 RepID=A0AAV9G665_9PEZI|nr:hypothetical protein QBC34DRAFT_195488 [Podospora aff. communis PSN243]